MSLVTPEDLIPPPSPHSGWWRAAGLTASTVLVGIALVLAYQAGGSGPRATVKALASQLEEHGITPEEGQRGDGGAAGRDGRDGTDGRDGRDGNNGLTVMGAIGRPGKDAPPARDGRDSQVPGPTGSPGTAGQDSTVPGPSGSPGAAGPDECVWRDDVLNPGEQVCSRPSPTPSPT